MTVVASLAVAASLASLASLASVAWSADTVPVAMVVVLEPPLAPGLTAEATTAWLEVADRFPWSVAVAPALLEAWATAPVGTPLPALRKLCAGGWSELVGMPYGSAVLPLLINTEHARAPVPDLELPARLLEAPEEARRQLSRGALMARHAVGTLPAAYWAPGGAVSAATLDLLAGLPFSSTPCVVAAGAETAAGVWPSWAGQAPVRVISANLELSRQAAAVADDETAGAAFLDRVYAQAVSTGPPYLLLIFGSEAGLPDLTRAVGSLAERLARDHRFRSVRVTELAAEVCRGRWTIWWDPRPWMGEPEENQAWDLLAGAWRAVRAYQNSGRADLKRLDAALRMLTEAERGDWFYWFGEDADSGGDAKLATAYREQIGLIYDALGQDRPAPTTDISTATIAGVGEGGGAAFHALDPEGDDHGDGAVTYPDDPVFLPGSFDLREFTVREETDTLRFEIRLGALPNPWKAPNGFSLVQVDVYLDLNHRAGAGATALLPGRGGFTRPADGWEFALSLNGWDPALYRSVPSGPVRVGAVAVEVDSATIVARIPRQVVRGDPSNWGYVVLTCGYDASVPEGTESGMGSRLRGNDGVRVVASTGTPGRFGGAAPGERDTPPSRILDVLVPPGENQAQVLAAYRTGLAVEIPAVRRVR